MRGSRPGPVKRRCHSQQRSGLGVMLLAGFGSVLCVFGLLPSTKAHKRNQGTLGGVYLAIDSAHRLVQGLRKAPSPPKEYKHNKEARSGEFHKQIVKQNYYIGGIPNRPRPSNLQKEPSAKLRLPQTTPIEPFWAYRPHSCQLLGENTKPHWVLVAHGRRNRYGGGELLVFNSSSTKKMITRL